MIASSKKRVRLTPHQKVVEDLKSRISGLEETVAKNRAEISDLEDQAGDMLRERDRFCSALNIGSPMGINMLTTTYAVRPTTPSFMEIAVHCGYRFALADLAEKYLKLEKVKNVLLEVDEHSEAIKMIRRNLEQKHS